MSYSFVIIDLKNECNISEIEHHISSNYKDYEILYCNTNNVKSGQDLFCYNFEQTAQTEEVVNVILKETKKDNIVLIRKFTDVNVFEQLTNKLENNNSVVYYTKKQNVFMRVFNKICKSVGGFVFGKTIKNINHFAIAYGKTISRVIRNLNCPSNSIRMNNWTGISEQYLETDVKFKMEYKKRRIVWALIPIFVSLFATILWFLIKTKLGMWYNLLTAFVVLLGFIFFFVFANMWYFRAQIGENIIEKAKYKLN